MKKVGGEWCSVVRFDSRGELRMQIKDAVYGWHGVSMQFMAEVEEELRKGYNQGRILERIERAYGDGTKGRN